MTETFVMNSQLATRIEVLAFTSRNDNSDVLEIELDCLCDRRYAILCMNLMKAYL